LVQPVQNPWALAAALQQCGCSLDAIFSSTGGVPQIDGALALAMAMGLRARDRGSAHAIDIDALIS